MEVYVKNGSGGPEIMDVIVWRVQDDKGTPINAKNPMEFTNTFSKATTLEVSKEVQGDFANKNLDFTYTINITLAPGETAASYAATKHDASGGTTATTVAVPTDTFTLKHGEKLVFDALPIGTKYTLEEAGSTNYIPEVTVTKGGLGLGTEHASTAGSSLAIGVSTASILDLQNPIGVDDGANIAAWLNDYPNITPTGIIMENLPFILLILVAIGGFVGFIIIKRRRTSHR